MKENSENSILTHVMFLGARICRRNNPILFTSIFLNIALFVLAIAFKVGEITQSQATVASNRHQYRCSLILRKNIECISD